MRVLSRNRTNRTHINRKGHLLDTDTTMAICTQKRPNSCSAHEAGGLSSPSLSLKDSWRLPGEGLVFSPCWKDRETDVSKGWLQHWWRQPQSRYTHQQEAKADRQKQQPSAHLSLGLGGLQKLSTLGEDLLSSCLFFKTLQRHVS